MFQALHSCGTPLVVGLDRLEAVADVRHISRAAMTRMVVMRRYLGDLGLGGGSWRFSRRRRTPSDETREKAVTAPVAVQRLNLPSTGLRDEAAMVLVGTALIGLAAAVRKAA